MAFFIAFGIIRIEVRMMGMRLILMTMLFAPPTHPKDLGIIIQPKEKKFSYGASCGLTKEEWLSGMVCVSTPFMINYCSIHRNEAQCKKWVSN